jgi:predicted membrane channel-forming protein YqfA (hemolysin III family)
MSAFIMLIAINGLAGFALGLLGRSRAAVLALPVSIFFSGAMLWFFGAAASQIVLKAIVCMFVGQAAFVAGSAIVFFSSTANEASVVASSNESVTRAHKRWARRRLAEFRNRLGGGKA